MDTNGHAWSVCNLIVRNFMARLGCTLHSVLIGLPGGARDVDDD